MIAVLAGGVGAARFLAGLVQVVPAAEVVAVVNVGDDTVLHGLHVSPDLDTVTYTLGGAVNPATGWGLGDETWQAMGTLERYGGPAWFRLGDRDLGTHLYRTGRLAAGAPLSEVTAEIARAWGTEVRVLPATDDRLRTMVTVANDGTGSPAEVGFQDYFVRQRHDVAVTAVRFDGAGAARPGPGVLDALARAERVIIAPSNPTVSIAPVLAVPGVREAVAARRADVVAVSPIVAGAALKGPADRLLRELGHESSVGGVARLYAALAATLVVDEADAAVVGSVRDAGVRALVTATVMSSPAVAAHLARACLEGR
ncbi:MAG: 2-phospho-L-lactate transferase [Acidimicrobiia bacterium]